MRMIKLALLLSGGLLSVVFAVGTSHWSHTSETDFKSGTLNDVVATNLGDLKLSRAVKVLLAQDARLSAVYAMAQLPDGTIYAATGPQGVLLQIKDDQVTTAAELGDNLNLVSLLADSKGRLLIGTAGEKGRIYRIDRPGAKPQSIFEADDVQYVWSMSQSSDGSIYAATGPNGQLFQIDTDGKSKLLFDSDENNLLCLASDGGDFLYAGSDPNGLIFRVNRKTGEMFVTYDAAESEISALALDKVGNLYAATAQATEPDYLEQPEVAGQGGRPEAQPAGVPIPSERPPMPEPPPDLPQPAPGEPLPIPRDTQPKSMRIFSQEEDEDDPSESVPKEPQQNIEAAAQLPTHAVGVIGGEPAAAGNAIYRIDRDGFVTEVFRQPVIVYCLVENNGTLLAGTGTAGEIWQINPAEEETSILAKADSRDVLSMLPSRDGEILLGLANSGQIASMTSGYASSGTYTSAVLDAGQISKFGKIRLRGTLPAGTGLRVSTRSSNVAGASDPGWSNWSENISASEFVQVPSPSARFLQYRLHFTSDDGKSTPIVESVDVAYQLPNLPPQISSVSVTPGDLSTLTGVASPDSHKYSISWEASDPNDDAVVYALSFRSGARDAWIPLKDKIGETSFEWETRSVADGAYQIKVEASDESANPTGTGRTASRVSDPVLVDNTAPAIGNIEQSVQGRTATIKFRAVDRAGVISSAGYAVNSSADWQAILPSDSIADSPEEFYSVTIPDLVPGQHQIMLRALDRRGNPAYESIVVSVAK